MSRIACIDGPPHNIKQFYVTAIILPNYSNILSECRVRMKKSSVMGTKIFEALRRSVHKRIVGTSP